MPKLDNCLAVICHEAAFPFLWIIFWALVYLLFLSLTIWALDTFVSRFSAEMAGEERKCNNLSSNWDFVIHMIKSFDSVDQLKPYCHRTCIRMPLFVCQLIDKKSSSFCLFVPIIFMVSTIDPNGTKENVSHLHKVQCCFGGRTWSLSNKSRSSYFFGGVTQKKGKIYASRRLF